MLMWRNLYSGVNNSVFCSTWEVLALATPRRQPSIFVIPNINCCNQQEGAVFNRDNHIGFSDARCTRDIRDCKAPSGYTLLLSSAAGSKQDCGSTLYSWSGVCCCVCKCAGLLDEKAIEWSRRVLFTVHYTHRGNRSAIAIANNAVATTEQNRLTLSIVSPDMLCKMVRSIYSGGYDK